MRLYRFMVKIPAIPRLLLATYLLQANESECIECVFAIAWTHYFINIYFIWFYLPEFELQRASDEQKCSFFFILFAIVSYLDGC